MEISTTDSYDQGFFADQRTTSEASAREVVPIILDLIQPKKIIDVGCGIGAWAQAFDARGIEVQGVDGDYVDRRQLCIPEDKFRSHDLTQPLRLKEEFDLAVCLEVAEHLPIARAASFVEDLVALAPVVVFSAAVPGQGGVMHLNEQWPDYWAALFGRCGYRVIDTIRSRIWHNEKVVWHYRQNLLIFVRESSLAVYPKLQAEVGQQGLRALSVVHPAMYSGLHFAADPRHISLGAAIRNFGMVLMSVLRRKLGLQDGSRPHANATLTPSSRILTS